MATLLILMFPILLILALHVHVRAEQRKRTREAYDFAPVNVHGGARFATNDDLRKAGLFK